MCGKKFALPLRHASKAICKKIDVPEQILQNHANMLTDESRITASFIQVLYLPASTDEVSQAFLDCGVHSFRMLVSGARTGITAAAVPLESDAVISMTNMRQILKTGFDEERKLHYVRVQAGLSLNELDEAIKQQQLDLPAESWIPLDPTERSASFGGVAACNASGARSYRFGAARNWIRGLTVVLPDGQICELQRGQCYADDGKFQLGDKIVNIPTIPKTTCRKYTLGYDLSPNMDLLDLFIGSEGTLGAITEVELFVLPEPSMRMGVMITLADEEKALSFVKQIRVCKDVTLDAIEYFDSDALLFLKAKRCTDGPDSVIANLPSWDGCIVYIEFSGETDKIDDALATLEKLLMKMNVRLDQTWAATEPTELNRQKAFRHALPEAVNAWIGEQRKRCSAIHKVGTDMAVPDDKLEDVFNMYRMGLQRTGLRSVVFGHIGDNHLHVNLLPANEKELEEAKNLYKEWAVQVVDMGGVIAAEHGIGRLKQSLFAVQYSEDVRIMLKQFRKSFDPKESLARGVLV